MGNRNSVIYIYWKKLEKILYITLYVCVCVYGMRNRNSLIYIYRKNSKKILYIKYYIYNFNTYIIQISKFELLGQSNFPFLYVVDK